MKWIMRFILFLTFLSATAWYFFDTKHLFFWVKPEQVNYVKQVDSLNRENKALKMQIERLKKDYSGQKTVVKREVKRMNKVIIRYVDHQVEVNNCDELIEQYRKVETAYNEQIELCDSLVNAQFAQLEQKDTVISAQRMMVYNLQTENYSLKKDLMITNKSNRTNKKWGTAIIAVLLIGLIIK